MAQMMQKSIVAGLAVAPVQQRRSAVQRPGRVVALAQPFAGRSRAAPKTGSLQIANAVAAREVDAIQVLENSTEQVAINAIRFLAIDGVNAANSGHPGLPMGCVVWTTSAPHSFQIKHGTMLTISQLITK